MWKLEEANVMVPVTIDNARNLVNAVGVLDYCHKQGALTMSLTQHHKKCSAAGLLAKIRKIMTFFHRSTTAAHVLKAKQDLLKLPTHKLIQPSTNQVEFNIGHDGTISGTAVCRMFCHDRQSCGHPHVLSIYIHGSADANDDLENHVTV